MPTVTWDRDWETIQLNLLIRPLKTEPIFDTQSPESKITRYLERVCSREGAKEVSTEEAGGAVQGPPPAQGGEDRSTLDFQMEALLCRGAAHALSASKGPAGAGGGWWGLGPWGVAQPI